LVDAQAGVRGRPGDDVGGRDGDAGGPALLGQLEDGLLGGQDPPGGVAGRAVTLGGGQSVPAAQHDRCRGGACAETDDGGVGQDRIGGRIDHGGDLRRVAERSREYAHGQGLDDIRSPPRRAPRLQAGEDLPGPAGHRGPPTTRAGRARSRARRGRQGGAEPPVGVTGESGRLLPPPVAQLGSAEGPSVFGGAGLSGQLGDLGALRPAQGPP